MKTPLFAVILVGTMLTTLPVRVALADDTTSAPTPAATAPSSDTSTDDVKAKKGEKLKEALAKLNLSDDQKAKIKNIISTETDRRTRREKIAAVLTPEQKAKFKEMMQKRRAEAGA